MRRYFDRLSDMTAVGRDETSMQDAISGLTQELGFDGYAYLNLQTNWSYAISNYPEEWQKLYFESGFEIIDPIIATAKSKMMAFTWSCETHLKHAAGDVKRFCAQAAEFNIRSGITVPIRTAFGHLSLFTFASRRSSLHLDKDIDVVAAASSVGQLHGKLEVLRLSPTSGHKMQLNPKETAYLQWAAEGKSMEDTAVLEEVKYNTVKLNLENIRKRYSGNIVQVVAMAIRQGLID